MLKKMMEYFGKRKWTYLLLLIILTGGCWYGYQKMYGAQIQPTYMTALAERGTLIKSIAGAGQVSASSILEVKAKASGEILKVNVKNGDSVKKGSALVELDARETQKSVRDAQANLESAQISLAKLMQKADSYTLLQARNAITAAESSLEKLKTSQPIDLARAEETARAATDALEKTYDEGYNAITAAFLDLPSMMTSLHDILYSFDLSKSQGRGEQQTNDYYLINGIPSSDFNSQVDFKDLVDLAGASYTEAKTAYDSNFTIYKNASREMDKESIIALLDQTFATVKQMSAAIKKETNVFDYWVDYHETRNHDIFSGITQYQTDLSALIVKANEIYSDLQNAAEAIDTALQSKTKEDQDLSLLKKNQPLDLAAAEASLKEKKAYLNNLAEGADALDIRAQELTVRQRANALYDAQEKVADYTIRAPFDGVVAVIDLQPNSDLSSGAVAATLITQQYAAEITLNEVDAAQVGKDMKAVLTFDAIDGLTITGNVSEVDTLGAVSQGVVSYGVKILFDTQDSRIKSGMSVSASLITAVKTDALLIPAEALKDQEGTTGTVELLINNALQTQNVEVGLINDTSAEILSGLNEGDMVITQTVTASTASTPTQSRSLFPGIGGGGGSNVGRLMR